VVVAGVHSRIELWDKATWDAEQEAADLETAALAEQIDAGNDTRPGLGI
jgi:DNA-binding transcriptional regulator/RsmH inhibitor MraZ